MPVVSVGILEEGEELDDADEIIAKLPRLLHSTRPQSWEEWFRSQGQDPLPTDGPSFEHFHMLVDAAKSGIGIALVPLAFVKRELAANLLVRLGQAELVAERAYYVVSDPASGLSTAQETFCKWLHQQTNSHS